MDHPARAGRYRIDGPLGEGGFSTVWLGYDEELEAPVAVKILREHWAGRRRVRERFLQEARLLRQADSHLIVQVFDIGELPDGRPYFVMSYADRGVLDDRLSEGSLSLGEIVHIADVVADALTVLHDMGVLHRDVKPSNVLIGTSPSGEERLLLSDLGIAKQFVLLQKTTAGLGTPGYAAPEQMPIAQDLDVRVDVYGLGALVYHLLAGHPPAPQEESVPPGSERGDVPQAVDDVVMRALTPDREKRWSSVRAFSDALSAAADEVGAGAVEAGAGAGAGEVEMGAADAPPPTGIMRTVVRLAIGAAVLAAAVAGSLLLWSSGGDDSLKATPAKGGAVPSTTPSTEAASSGAAADSYARWLNLDSDIPEGYRALIVKAGTMCSQPGLSPAFIAAMLKAESGFDPKLSDPSNNEYGIARWTPSVLWHWQPDGLHAPEPKPPFSPELSILSMGKFFCTLGPEIASVPGDPAANLMGLYRSSVPAIQRSRGVPPQWKDQARRVEQYRREYQPG